MLYRLPQLSIVVFLIIAQRILGYYIHCNRLLAFQKLGTFALLSHPQLKHPSRRFRRTSIKLQQSPSTVVFMSVNPSQNSNAADSASCIDSTVAFPLAAAPLVTSTTTTATHSNVHVTAAIEYANLVGQLKILPRTGWIRRNIFPCESVADHSWRVAILAFLLLSSSTTTTTTKSNSTNLDFDFGKVIQMALIHDVAECIVGDITPEDNVSQEDKHQLEYNAMIQITKLLLLATTTDAQAVPTEIEDNLLMKLFNEHEERQSIESIIVKDLDLLDMILQANTYEQQYTSTDIDLSDFFISTPPSRFQIPQLRRIAEQIHQQRNDRINSVPPRNNTDGNNNCCATKISPDNDRNTDQDSPSSVDCVNDDIDPSIESQPLVSTLSKSDLTFVAEYTKTLPPLSPQSQDSSTRYDDHVLATILALRQWETTTTHQKQQQHQIAEE